MIEARLLRRTRYTVTLDHGQFHLYDRRDASAEEDDVAALVDRALAGDGIARGAGTVVVLSPHQNNVAMPLTVEQWDGPPPDDLADWQEGYLVGLTVDEHGLGYQSPTMGTFLLDLPPGTWQARITGRGFVNRGWPGSTTPGDVWRLQAWPATAVAGPRRILRWTPPGEPRPGDGPVAAAWRRIVGWCAEHAPVTAATVRPPAGEDAITAAERATGQVWPEELKAWYRLHDGVGLTFAGCLLPFHPPFSLAELLQDRERRLEVWAGATGWNDRTVAELEASPAGTVAGTFLASYLPIGFDGTGCALVVDTRSGPLNGSIISWDKIDSDICGPAWPSLTAMLEDVAAALETGSPAAGWRATVVDGELVWEPDDDPDS